MKTQVLNSFLFIILLLSICSFSSSVLGQHETRVAWIELRNKSGQIIQLEPEFFYAHVAIQVGNQWLHAHPKRGVELSSLTDLQDLGTVKEVWASGVEDNSYLEKAPSFLGKEFDSEFSWSDEKIYCAELVAKLLGIQPSPMHFDEQLWDPWFKKYEGLPGSSPSKIYHEVQRRGYERIF